MQQGQALTHAQNSSEITISQPGTYYAHYQAQVTPASGDTFPVVNSVAFALNGQVQGTGNGEQLFSASGQTAQINASLVFNVTSVPTTLTVVSSGGSFLYSSATVNVFKV